MGIVGRSSLRRIGVVAIATTALSGAFLAQGEGRPSAQNSVSTPVANKKLDLSDVMRVSLAAGDKLHLRIAGVTTGPVTADHTNDIPMSSFQFGVGRGVSGGTTGVPRAVTKPNISEITVTKTQDQWTTKLLNSALRGTSNSATGAPTATIYFSAADASSATGFRDYLQVDLKEVLISGYSVSSGGDKPSESLSLNFSNVMTITSRAIPGGAVQTVSYNLTTQV